MMMTEILKIVISGILMLSILLAIYLLKKKIVSTQKGSASASLRLVGSLQLGTRERLVVVEAEGERLLLALGPSHLTLVTSLKKADALPTIDSQRC